MTQMLKSDSGKLQKGDQACGGVLMLDQRSFDNLLDGLYSGVLPVRLASAKREAP
jgi:hypothetical protein